MKQWDKGLYSKNPILDVPGLGQYSIREGEKQFRAYLNGKSTKIEGTTVEEVQAKVERRVKKHEIGVLTGG